jgi:hypothetical protein
MIGAQHSSEDLNFMAYQLDRKHVQNSATVSETSVLKWHDVPDHENTLSIELKKR